MKQLGVWDPLAVKLQVYKTAIEVRKWIQAFLFNCSCAQTAVLLLRIDDILSGTKKSDGSDREGPKNQIADSQQQSGPGMDAY